MLYRMTGVLFPLNVDPAILYARHIFHSPKNRPQSMRELRETTSGGSLPPAVIKEYRNPKDGSEFVLIPAGEFEMRDGEEANCSGHRVFLDAYYIGKFAVTNAQYALFAKSTGHRPPNNDFWNTPEKADHPVTNVSWDDAVAYAKWAGCELPTEAQWEKAARGSNGHLFPWGNSWDESKCRNSVGSKAGGTSSVDAYPEGMSGYGTYQQAGNVWEWCADWYDEDYYKDPEAAHNPEGPLEGTDRVLRGGSWESRSVVHFRGTSRFALEPFRRICDLGFRLARRA